MIDSAAITGRVSDQDALNQKTRTGSDREFWDIELGLIAGSIGTQFGALNFSIVEEILQPCSCWWNVL